MIIQNMIRSKMIFSSIFGLLNAGIIFIIPWVVHVIKDDMALNSFIFFILCFFGAKLFLEPHMIDY